MLKQKDFLTYPPGTRIAPEEADEDTKRLAVFGEWQRFYFEPALEKLGTNGFSRRAARRVLHLSYDFLQFEEVMKRQRFYLPLQAEQQLRDTTIQMLTVAGKYWADYYNKLERGCLEGPLVAIGPDDMPAALGRFTKMKLDAFTLWARLTLAARYPRYWLILRIALFHYFRDEGIWPSANFRDVHRWRDRFYVMERCLWPDFRNHKFMKDPVTKGGAVGRHNAKLFSKACAMLDTEAIISCLVSNVTSLVDDCPCWAEIDDAGAVQAVWAFLEMLNPRF
ncbi:uncharacterized protein SCHCODRAFT_02567847 [Schizophyllum commune H4-8]|nr:uncharacterized protein SCHCODRAFT_02567847 [Schizophyllum commune H4-8]KAI5898864.1 hypothetical protein SCHCODRAFT_02567847 [Schizophyllum commune H4-8]